MHLSKKLTAEACDFCICWITSAACRLPASVVTHAATSVVEQQAALIRGPGPDCHNKCSTVPEASLACPSVLKWTQQTGLWQMWPIGTWSALPSSQRQNGAAASVAFFPAPVSASAEMLKVNPAQARLPYLGSTYLPLCIVLGLTKPWALSLKPFNLRRGSFQAWRAARCSA